MDFKRGGFLFEAYRNGGVKGCTGKIFAAAKMWLSPVLLGRRTNSSVGAYFDLITDDARLFYGDSFHFGFFKEDTTTLEEALSNHTDIVARMARIAQEKHVLDLGCGICAPAVRIVSEYGCRVTGINISKEQVRQGRAFVEGHKLSDRITVCVGNALDLDFDDETFDSVVCLEVASDICVTEAQKLRLAQELHRVLKPGGSIGFSDLVFRARPTREEDLVLRAVLYHEGAELVTDWPAIFASKGFVIERALDILKDTMKTWEHSLAVYETRAEEVNRRYGRKIANQVRGHLSRIPGILDKYASFIVMSVVKPT